MIGFDEAIQCKECGRVYWNRESYCDHPPKYCRRCGAQLFAMKEEKVKKCCAITGFEYWEIKKVYGINETKARTVIAKKNLFWWTVRNDDNEN